MAALAQMVNVIQSVLLTEGDKMVKTPTYHVMHMYRYHQDADLLESAVTGVEEIGVGEWKVPKVTESVSKGADGVITITVNNLSMEESEALDIRLVEKGYRVCEARVVSHEEVHSYNTFEQPEVVVEKEFTDYQETEDGIRATLPKNSVVLLRLKK